MIRPETTRILMVLIAFHGDLGSALDDTAKALRTYVAADDVAETVAS